MSIMEKTEPMPAPDFILNDQNGNPLKLSDYKGSKKLVLIFNRGFV